MAAPPSYSVADLERHFADEVFPANYNHDLQLRLTGSSLLRLVGSSRYIEVAKSLVFRIYAFLDGARSSGILDPYKAWTIDVKETETSSSRNWTASCAVRITPTASEQIPHYSTPGSLLGTSRPGVPRPRGVLRVPNRFYVAAWPGTGRVAHVAFMGGQSHTMADPRHWGNIAYQGLFKHLSESSDGSQWWALHGQKGTDFEAKTDPTRLFEEGTESLSCFFEEHPFVVQARG
ncbi:Regulatory protein E2 [Rhodotorula toruloides ATCC 204091]|uniref:Regulatory protein E2 n=1 Tax=Rhodotorula toruloides TaxID=5286 RepID=A0A0K3C8R4_RHOTO|nr:Regulatory protein E2 [Rhodotorula toruloides ATCC 204091]KAK4335555.1 Regulatory protein E2 [Rhodotorula toruloides]PRQ78124.1 regulatory protein E2 [Rhodotorula toruloides]